MTDRREELTGWFEDALADLAVGPRLATRLGALTAARPAARWLVVAFGKAARPMATVALQVLPRDRVRGLVVPPEPDDAQLEPLEVIAGGHPLPTAGSLRAGRRALALCASAAADEHVVFLVSGGGSALLESPIDPGVSLAEVRELHRALVGCGAPIDVVNAVRRRCSAVKGGRLAAAAAAAAAQHSLLVSDVPARAGVAAIASGPTVAPPAEDAAIDLRALVDRLGLLAALPAALRGRLHSGDLPPPLAAGDPAFARSTHEVLLDDATAREALRRRAEAAGCVTRVVTDCDDWPYERAAAHLLAQLDDLATAHPGRRVAVVSGGELSVPLPAAPGVGGRNQQFALHCATRIAGRTVRVLSAGTDGIDGTAPAAGAVVDGTTCARAAALGLDVADHLRWCDAHPLFKALGDAIVTGPTGTNVRDLRLLVR